MKHVQVAIIGSGPAGYTAGVYAARAALAPTIFAGQKAGGQLMWTTDVENFPGFPAGIKGPDLMMAMMEQAQKFGATISYEYVTAVDLSERPFKLWTSVPKGVVADTAVSNMTPEAYATVRAEIIKSDPDFTADAVISATGATSIMLGAPGEMDFLGKGVSTCAVCDAAFYREKETFVVGGGDSAMEDAMALTKFAKSVTLVHRRDSFKASKIMQDRVLNNPKVKVLWNSTVAEVRGDTQVRELLLKTPDGEKTVAADGIFVAIGHRPITGIFAGQLELDGHGYLVTRQSMSQAGTVAAQAALSKAGLVEFPSMTSVPGVFGAGDGVDVRYKQAITAAGQGCAAAIDAERWLESQK